MANYIVRYGESLWDVVLNQTGSLTNLNEILEFNNFGSWTPVLFAGQSIAIPDGLFIDSNNLRQLADYPACNNAEGDVKAKIISIFASIENGWILTTGFWNDSQIWKDQLAWVD